MLVRTDQLGQRNLPRLCLMSLLLLTKSRPVPKRYSYYGKYKFKTKFSKGKNLILNIHGCREKISTLSGAGTQNEYWEAPLAKTLRQILRNPAYFVIIKFNTYIYKDDRAAWDRGMVSICIQQPNASRLATTATLSYMVGKDATDRNHNLNWLLNGTMSIQRAA